MKPIIGVLTSVDNERTTSAVSLYVEPIERSGGIPIVLPFTLNSSTHKKYAELCDGFFFSGGADIDPLYYGEEASAYCGELEPYRDSHEFSMLDDVLRLKKPILAICRGIQLINVGLGGTLYQDIPSELNTPISHRQKEPKLSHSHHINVLADTPLSDIFGEGEILVNSFHHQAIKSLGKGLSPMAFAEDGIIEAVYLKDYPYLRGYQWHSERLYDSDSYNRKLLDDFICACKELSVK